MKQLVFLGLWLALVGVSHATPYYSYDIHGTVTGNVTAADSLFDVEIGDEFVIRLNIWARNSADHRVSFQGKIGGWSFQAQESIAYYLYGDSSPERFYTTGGYSTINPPAGNGSLIYPNDIFLTLMGVEQTGTVDIPEEKWLIRESGEINLDQFHSGSFSFWFFTQTAEGGGSTEEDLFGVIHRIVEVPEPGSFALAAFSFFFVVMRIAGRNRCFSNF
jgi:hypothetical protein